MARRRDLKNFVFGEGEETAPQEKRAIALSAIVLPPSQPRRYFDPEAMAALVESVKQDGVLQPILVRPLGERYELVAGERRYRAAKAAGLVEIPAIAREMSAEQARFYALTENLQREDLNPVEETEGILQLLALKLGCDAEGAIALLNARSNARRGFTDNVVRNEQQQIIDAVFARVGGLSAESFRTHRLPLLNLPAEILQVLRQGKIAYTKAKAIARVKDEERRRELLAETIEAALTLSQLKERIAQLNRPDETPEPTAALKTRIEDTYRRLKRSRVWDDPKKQKRLEKLLGQLEQLL